MIHEERDGVEFKRTCMWNKDFESDNDYKSQCVS